MIHTLPKLPYSYNELEPYIDAATMEIHFSKHHQAYINNLNKALEEFSDFSEHSVEYLLQNLDTLPEQIKETVKNNGGGHYNHTFFWTILTPKQTQPSPELTETISQKFGSIEDFKKIFSELALKRFGSGWAWLVTDSNGNLEIISTPNQDSPISQFKTPILGIDVWEHAYYLKYQNKRADYIESFWNIVNWPQVETYYLNTLKNN